MHTKLFLEILLACKIQQFLENTDLSQSPHFADKETEAQREVPVLKFCSM